MDTFIKILAIWLVINNTLASQDEFFQFGAVRSKPTLDDFTLVQSSVQISASTVCGYTDWTTASIRLPKHLITKEYYKALGKRGLRMAKNSLSNLSGALPGMIACNVSPTYCSLWRHNQFLALAEIRLMKNDCQMFEKIENETMLQSKPLSRCIKETMEKEQIRDGEARERCLNMFSDNPEKVPSKDEVNNGLAGFKDKGNQTEILENAINSNGYLNRRFTKAIIPGLSVQARAIVNSRRSGRWVIDDELFNRTEENKKGLIQLVNRISRERKNGKARSEIITSLNKELQERKAKDSPIHEEKPGGVKRRIIPIELAYRISEMVPGDTSSIGQVADMMIEKIAKDKALYSILGELTEIKGEAEMACRVDPEVQKKELQLMCDATTRNAQTQIDYLLMKRDIEDQLAKNQFEIYQMAKNYKNKKAEEGAMMNWLTGEKDVIVPYGGIQ